MRVDYSKCEFSKTTKIEARKRAGHACELCGQHGDQNNVLEAHHIIPLSFICYFTQAIIPYLRSLQNCRILCHDCHGLEDEQANFTTIDQIILRAVLMFDENRDVLSTEVQQIQH